MERVGLVDDFLRLRGRALSPGTVKAYTYALSTWEAYLGDRRWDPAAWTIQDIELWQDGLAERGLSPRTQQLCSAGMRSLLKWAVRHDRPVDHRLYLAVESVRAPRLLPRPLPSEHLDRLITFFRPLRPHAPITYYRDRALFYFLLSTGARVSEALQMNVDDATSSVIVRQKGGHSKVLFAPQFAQETIADYLRHRTDNHPALWVTRGTPEHPIGCLSSDGVREIWIRVARQVGIPRFTTHQLRHSCATYLLNAGVASEVVAAHLGHHGLGSLAGYAELRLGRRAEAVAAMQELTSGEQELRPDNVAGVILKGGRGRRTRLA